MFRWRDAYSVNIKVIDEQHKNLFKIGRSLYEMLKIKEECQSEIVKVLKELKEYIIYHFSEEEKYMKEYNYDEYEKHKLEHEFFIKKIKEFNQQIDREKELFAFTEEMQEFIADWIENHILRTDQRYSKFFNEKGIY